LTVTVVPDPTNNPVDRARITLDPSRARTTAWDMTEALTAGDPSIAVRAEDLEHNYFELDPCNLTAEEAGIVADRILLELKKARSGAGGSTPFSEWRARQEQAIWDI
jgi:L-seryl-tRNA(Ser) seleniumtransferase